MKIFLFLLLVPSILLASKIEVNLTPVKNNSYSIKKGKGILLFNFFENEHVFVISSISERAVSKLINPIYTTQQDRFFWIITEGIISALKKYKFKNGKYIYFSFINSDTGTFYENMFFKINSSELIKVNNRDFSTNDNNLVRGESYKKYKILPLRSLFKSISISSSVNNKLLKSNKLTNLYNIFIDEYTFQSIGKYEFIIENNKLIIDDLIKNIHSYCISGNYEKIKLYIDLGLDKNKRDIENNHTLLEYAAANGHYRIVKLLIDTGADPNIRKKGFENAYLAAKRAGFYKIARLLKPLTEITIRPKKSNNINIYSCYNINSDDLANSCIGQVKSDVSFCYIINNNDLKNSCIGQVKSDVSFCYIINNNDLKNSCIGQVKSDVSFCYIINNDNLKDLCEAQIN